MCYQCSSLILIVHNYEPRTWAADGIEPSTYYFLDSCSTSWATRPCTSTKFTNFPRYNPLSWSPPILINLLKIKYRKLNFEFRKLFYNILYSLFYILISTAVIWLCLSLPDTLSGLNILYWDFYTQKRFSSFCEFLNENSSWDSNCIIVKSYNVIKL